LRQQCFLSEFGVHLKGVVRIWNLQPFVPQKLCGLSHTPPLAARQWGNGGARVCCKGE
jgi:hypothetical protein